MKRPKQLILIRHAESSRNEAKKSVFFADEYARRHVKGIPDYKIPITEAGKENAIKTGEYLKEHFGTFDYVYHSGYKRTKDTLEAILEAYSQSEKDEMTIHHNAFIRERDPGFAYDMTEEEAKKAFPWLQEYWDTYGGFFAYPPGGESIAKMAERVYQFIGMLYEDHVDEKILVVTHGGTIRAFRFLLEKWNYEQAITWPSGSEPKNCGITVYDYKDSSKHLELSEYNTVV
ncbi:MAG: Histidine phosphatase family protein [Patescibacteria group bacterium]|jgi:broad specificity phosphatase PhoE|nr:Histidine phosphatase family protein [Patescibacteria group bacterium]